jgi:hypothetical protein
MGIIVFSLAAILSMPKQFITVYLGVILEQSATGKQIKHGFWPSSLRVEFAGTTDAKSRLISNIVLSITVLITVLAMWYIIYAMNKVKPEVIYGRRKAR